MEGKEPSTVAADIGTGTMEKDRLPLAETPDSAELERDFQMASGHDAVRKELSAAFAIRPDDKKSELAEMAKSATDFYAETRQFLNALDLSPIQMESMSDAVGSVLNMYRQSGRLNFGHGINHLRKFFEQLKSFVETGTHDTRAERSTFASERLGHYLDLSSKNGFRSADQILWNMRRAFESHGESESVEPGPQVTATVPLSLEERARKERLFRKDSLGRKIDILLTLESTPERQQNIARLKQQLSAFEA